MNSEVERKINYRKKSFIRMTRDSVLIILSLLVFRSSFFEPYRIPSGSMIPTLEIGDFILVNKFEYGLKIPFTDISLGGLNLDPIYFYKKEDVERGDVIVFKYPNDPSINYIKRVIGLPGETIEIKNKKVFVDGKLIEESPIDTDDTDNYDYFKVDNSYTVRKDRDNIYKLNFEKKKIPQGHYFVMGDNRDSSSDSRAWGFVPFKNIRGKAFFIWFSMKQDDYTGSVSVKTNRIFHSIN